MHKQYPFYIKLACVFIGLYAIIFMLILGKDILIPIIYATIIAILLNPLVNLLTQRKINRSSAIFLVVLVTSMVLFSVFYLILAQITLFSDALPTLKAKLDSLTNELIQTLVNHSNFHKSEIIQWVENTENKEFYHFSIFKKLNQLSNILITSILLPIYLVLILYYKPLFIEFIKQLFQDKHHSIIAEVLANTKKIIQHYLMGLVVELLIMFVLYAITLYFLDNNYAFLLAFIAALVNILPFIGGIIGILVCMLVTLITKSPIDAVYIFLVFSAIQLLDKNLLVPKIVSKSVQINGFVSIVVVIISAAIWGLHGMFLSIPLTAILKVIFDHITPLKPWGFLLGNKPTYTIK